MGTLYLIATPIGNLEDISLRAARILTSVKVIACEDTRRTGRLLEHIRTKLDVVVKVAGSEKTKLIIFADFNEDRQIPYILERLRLGQDVGLVTDGGSPLFSDPGYRLVRAVLDSGVGQLEVVPGPSAAVAAVQISGLPTDRVLVWGFLPKKAGDKGKIFAKLKDITGEVAMTIVFFDSPHRLGETLKELVQTSPLARVAIIRELTKMHEEVVRGEFDEVLANLTSDVRGEVTLVVRMGEMNS